VNVEGLVAFEVASMGGPRCLNLNFFGTKKGLERIWVYLHTRKELEARYRSISTARMIAILAMQEMRCADSGVKMRLDQYFRWPYLETGDRFVCTGLRSPLYSRVTGESIHYRSPCPGVNIANELARAYANDLRSESEVEDLIANCCVD